jgi:hypothetical protein
MIPSWWGWLPCRFALSYLVRIWFVFPKLLLKKKKWRVDICCWKTKLKKNIYICCIYIYMLYIYTHVIYIYIYTYITYTHTYNYIYIVYTTNADVKCVHHQPDDHHMIPVQWKYAARGCWRFVCTLPLRKWDINAVKPIITYTGWWFEPLWKI